MANSYEAGTQRLATSGIAPAGAANVQNATFTYDPAGRVTAIADVGDGSPGKTDRQCFSYDWAGQLREAWTSAETTCGSTPTLTTTGAAPYWASYSYDASYRRTAETMRTPRGSTTQTLTYAGTDQARPHAPVAVSVDGAAQGSLMTPQATCSPVRCRLVAGRASPGMRRGG